MCVCLSLSHMPEKRPRTSTQYPTIHRELTFTIAVIVLGVSLLIILRVGSLEASAPGLHVVSLIVPTNWDSFPKSSMTCSLGPSTLISRTTCKGILSFPDREGERKGKGEDTWYVKGNREVIKSTDFTTPFDFQNENQNHQWSTVTLVTDYNCFSFIRAELIPLRLNRMSPALKYILLFGENNKRRGL